jgi:HEAT repeat protein
MIWWNTLSLKTLEPAARCKILESLRPDGPVHGLDLLLASLQDDDAAVRATAARQLGTLKLKEPEAVDGLRQRLTDESLEVRKAAAIALRSLEWFPADPVEIALMEVALGNRTYDTNAAALTVSDASEPGNASLTQLQELMRALADENPNIRASAIHALADHGTPEVTFALRQCLQDADEEVRKAAARTLSQRKAPELPSVFKGLLQDRDPELRIAAIHFLARHRDHAVADHLVSLLSDTEAPVRLAAAKALASLPKTPGSARALMMALLHSDAAVRQIAEATFAQLDPVR